MPNIRNKGHVHLLRLYDIVAGRGGEKRVQEFQTRLSAIFRRLQQACHGWRLYFFIHVSAVKL